MSDLKKDLTQLDFAFNIITKLIYSNFMTA